MDRDDKFCPTFRDFLKNEGVPPLLPPRSLNLNAYIEWFVKSVKSEYLSQMNFFGEKSLRRAAQQFLIDFHSEKDHQVKWTPKTGPHVKV